MGVNEVRRPTEAGKEFSKKLQRNMKKCPFCNEYLGKIEIMKRKVTKICRCKNCGKLILDVHIVW